MRRAIPASRLHTGIEPTLIRLGERYSPKHVFLTPSHQAIPKRSRIVKPPLRLTFAAVIATLVVVGVSAAEWNGQVGLDFWNLPSLNAHLADENRVAEKLEADVDEVHVRISLKYIVVADLSAGRIGLLAAAARFRALNAGSESFAAAVEAMFPEMSEDERVCRNVIAYAESTKTSSWALGLRLRLELFVLKVAGRLRIPDLPQDAVDKLVRQAPVSDDR